MLDDIKFIHQRDKSDALGLAEKQFAQYLHIYNFKWRPPRPVHEVVIAGMGGSGLGGKAIASLKALNVPITIVQDYALPKHVNQNTLLICDTYSGDTEEVLNIFEHAVGGNLPIDARLMVVSVAAGGKLAQLSKQNKVPLVELPKNIQPRMAFGYQLRALVEIFEQAGVLAGGIELLTGASKHAEQVVKEWLPTVPTKKNLAKQIANELMGKSIVVYSGPLLGAVAYKWKISFNENAKHVAWCGQLPEFNHNEMLGWTEQPVQKPYAVIDLRSNLEHPRTQKRFEVTERLLSGKRPAPIVIEPKGSNPLEQMFWAVALGDFVSLYLALLSNLDPTPVALVEKFKKAIE